MAGFGKLTLVGEYFGNSIVNVFHYRSEDWLPFAGNPFDDMLTAIDAFLDHVKTEYLQGMTTNYTLLRCEGVGYSDNYTIVTDTPVVRTVNEPGGLDQVTSGAMVCANIRFVLGQQTNINGIGHSKRNRGFIAYGPIGEIQVDNFGHIADGYVSGVLSPLAQKLDDTLTDLEAFTSLIPIRVHTKRVGGILILRTYSDVVGYVLPRRASFRRSRLPEA